MNPYYQEMTGLPMTREAMREQADRARDMNYLGMMGKLSGDEGMSAAGGGLVSEGTALRKSLAEAAGGANDEWKFKTDPVAGGGIWVNEDTGEAYYANLPEAPAGWNPVTGGGMPEQGSGDWRRQAKATEDEKKTAASIRRLSTNAAEIARRVQENPGAAQPGFMEQVLTTVAPDQAGAAMDADRQVVRDKYSTIIEDVLYLVTGAAYNEEQRKGMEQAYIPQYWDKPEAVREKARNMVNFVLSNESRIGRAMTDEIMQSVEKMYSGILSPQEIREMRGEISGGDMGQPAPGGNMGAPAQVAPGTGGFRIIGVE